MPGRQNQYVPSAGSGAAVRKHSEDVMAGEKGVVKGRIEAQQESISLFRRTSKPPEN